MRRRLCSFVGPAIPEIKTKHRDLNYINNMMVNINRYVRGWNTAFVVWGGSYIFCIAFSALLCNAEMYSEEYYTKLRNRMVSEQIIARGVGDEGVLNAMRTVKRHLFVPENLHDRAYEDTPLPIGFGQTISQPYIVALMTETLKLDRSMKVLEIGTGSGYQAAVASMLCRHVYSIEIIESLGKEAQKRLSAYPNVTVRIGDGYKGWKEHAPFDAIIVTCAPTHIPAPLVEQLKEGGKMVIPVGEMGNQELVLLTKKEGSIVQESIIPVRFVPMIDSTGTTY